MIPDLVTDGSVYVQNSSHCGRSDPHMVCKKKKNEKKKYIYLFQDSIPTSPVSIPDLVTNGSVDIQDSAHCHRSNPHMVCKKKKNERKSNIYFRIPFLPVLSTFQILSLMVLMMPRIPFIAVPAIHTWFAA